jgi:Ran GTPase-activating protein (RanGAP) involved in mRNA processing and transport
MCTNLTQLSLAQNKLGDDLTHLIVRGVLLFNTTLTHLDLAGTMITDDGVRDVAPLLSGCPTLIRLGLNDNRLGADTKAKIRTSWNVVHAQHRDGLWM